VVALALLTLHCFLKPLFNQGLNGGRQKSHLLVAPFLSGLLSISGLTLERRNKTPISVIPTTFLGIVSQMGSALCLALLAKLAGPSLL
jgi:hypothetical protein